MKCLKGCTLDLVDCTAGAGRRGARRREVAVDVIDSEHPELKTKFVLTQGVPECKQCPGCKQRVLKIKLADMESQPQQPLRLDDRGGRQEPAEKGAIRSSGRYAFSAALWAPEDGSEEDLEKYIADAIHVGFQLQASRENNSRSRDVDRVLLVADTARDGIGFNLLDMLWKLKPVEHVQVNPSLVEHCQKRFTKVFTKIRHWDLEEYTQVVALDLDLLVKRGVTDLLGVKTPAAFFRGNRDTILGDHRGLETLFNMNTGMPQGGINAGVMVLEPSSEECRKMEDILGTPGHRRQIEGSAAPEQDFLSLHFGEKWNSLPVKFNWQPHQIRYLFDGRSTAGGLTSCDRMSISWEEMWAKGLL